MCNRYRVKADGRAIAANFGEIIAEDPLRPPGELFLKRAGIALRHDVEPLALHTRIWGPPSPASPRSPTTDVHNLTAFAGERYSRGRRAKPAHASAILSRERPSQPTPDEWSG